MYHRKYGLQMPWETKIGSGLRIIHFGVILINENSLLEKNFTVAQGVTLGKSSIGKNKGFSTIDDNVYIGPGAAIIGNVHIGNNASIIINFLVQKMFRIMQWF
jgi:serine O-acetyltransferase